MSPGDRPSPAVDEAIARVTAPGERFEIEVVDVRGVPTKAFVRRFRSLRDVAAFARDHARRWVA